MSLIDNYLKWLTENIPFVGGISAVKQGTYKRASYLGAQPKIEEEEEEEVEEYTSYNPQGSGYGMMLQRTNLAGGGSSGGSSMPYQSTVNSQKRITPKIVIKLRNVKKRKKEKEKPK